MKKNVTLYEDITLYRLQPFNLKNSTCLNSFRLGVR